MKNPSIILRYNISNMKKYINKIIAPIIISLLMIVYVVFYFTFLIYTIQFLYLKILFGIIPIALIGAMVYTLIQRIKEIKGGEEDDLSKY